MGKRIKEFCRRTCTNKKMALFLAVVVAAIGVLPFFIYERPKEVHAAELILEDAGVSAPLFNPDNFLSDPSLDVFYYGGRPFYEISRFFEGSVKSSREWLMFAYDSWGTSRWGETNGNGQEILDNTAAYISQFGKTEQSAMIDKLIQINVHNTVDAHPYCAGKITAKLFPLSLDEQYGGAYSVSSLIKKYARRSFEYWTRTYSRNGVAFTNEPGSGTKVTDEINVLPAFYLDMTKVYIVVDNGIFSQNDDGSNIYAYKFMISDNTINSLSSSISGKKILGAQAGVTYAIPYTEVNTKADGGQKYISTILYDDTGKIVQHKKLASVTGESGTVNYTVPDDLELDQDYTLALFEETDNPGYETNYCSTPVYAGLSVSSTPVQTGIHAAFDGRICEGKSIPKSQFTVTPEMSDGSSSDSYAEDDFYIMKTGDLNSLDTAVLADEAQFVQAEGVDAVTADMLPEGAASGTTSVTVVTYTGETARPYFTTEVNVKTKARGAEDDLLDEYGSWEELADRIKELEGKLADAEELLKVYKASVENIQGQLDDETAKNQTLQETLADLEKEKNSLQEQYDALEDTTTQQAQTIRDQIAALQEKEDRITALRKQVQDIEKEITALQAEAEENKESYQEILAKVNELLADDEKLDGTGSDNAALKAFILSGLSTIKEKLAGLEAGISDLRTDLNGAALALEEALTAAGIDIFGISGGDSLAGSTDAETYEHILAAITELSKKIGEARTEADGYKESLVTALEQIAVIQGQLDSEIANSQSLQNQLDRLKSEKEALQEQYDSLDDLNSEQAEQIAAQIRELEKKEAELSDLQEQNKNLTDALDRLKSEKQSLQEQYDALEDKESAQAKELQAKIDEITAKEQELAELKKQMELIQGNIHSLQEEVNGYSSYFAELLAKINGLLREDQKIDGTGSTNAELKIKIAAGISLVKENLEQIHSYLNGAAVELEQALRETGIDFTDISADGTLTGATDGETYRNITAAVKKLSEAYKGVC